jgi:hypothetical protein
VEGESEGSKLIPHKAIGVPRGRWPGAVCFCACRRVCLPGGAQKLTGRAVRCAALRCAAGKFQRQLGPHCGETSFPWEETGRAARNETVSTPEGVVAGGAGPPPRLPGRAVKFSPSLLFPPRPRAPQLPGTRASPTHSGVCWGRT